MDRVPLHWHTLNINHSNYGSYWKQHFPVLKCSRGTLLTRDIEYHVSYDFSSAGKLRFHRLPKAPVVKGSLWTITPSQSSLCILHSLRQCLGKSMTLINNNYTQAPSFSCFTCFKIQSLTVLLTFLSIFTSFLSILLSSADEPRLRFCVLIKPLSQISVAKVSLLGGCGRMALLRLLILIVITFSPFCINQEQLSVFYPC